MKGEIQHLDDIKLLVDAFYNKVRQDELIGPLFNSVIQDRWPTHLIKMYSFWQTVLLGENSYYGNPFMAHANLPLEKVHFERWIELFYQTLDEHFEGEVVDEAKWRAAKMAEMFHYKLESNKESNTRSLL